MAAERAALSCLGTTLSGIKGVAWGGVSSAEGPGFGGGSHWWVASSRETGTMNSLAFRGEIKAKTTHIALLEQQKTGTRLWWDLKMHTLNYSDKGLLCSSWAKAKSLVCTHVGLLPVVVKRNKERATVGTVKREKQCMCACLCREHLQRIERKCRMGLLGGLCAHSHLQAQFGGPCSQPPYILLYSTKAAGDSKLLKN